MGVIAVFFGIGMYAGEKSGRLQSLQVARTDSRGGTYYPLAVFIVFYLAQGQIWLYITTMLILTTADAAAALVGSSYGRIYFTLNANTRKTLEGSFFFWILTFLAVELSLLLLTNFPRLTCILTAYLVASLLTGIEAVSSRGTDNIFVPVAACIILVKITAKPIDEIFFQCLSMTCMSIILLAGNSRLKLFGARDCIIFTLAMYGVWALGSFHWAIPALAAFLLAAGIFVIMPADKAVNVETHSLIHIILVPFLILATANWLFAFDAMYGPFLVSVLIIALGRSWARLQHGMQAKRAFVRTWFIMGSLAFCLLVTLLCAWSQNFLPRGALLAVPGVVLVMLFIASSGKITLYNNRVAVLQTAWLSLFGAVLYTALQKIGWIAVWQPMEWVDAFI